MDVLRLCRSFLFLLWRKGWRNLVECGGGRGEEHPLLALRIGVPRGDQSWSKLSRSGDVQPETNLPWPYQLEIIPIALELILSLVVQF